MRIVFAGTPGFAARALEAILNAGHTVARVLTQPDRPAGRGLELQPSPVKRLALDRGLAGPLKGPSSYFMKTPPEQYTDDVARRKTEDFIANK